MTSVARPVYGVVYAVTHTTDPERVRYYGQTTGELERRRRGHYNDRNRVNLPMSRWVRKHAHEWDQVVFSVVRECYSREELDQAETEFIARGRKVGHADLNVAHGGFGNPGNPVSDETKAKLSEAFRGENSYAAKFTWAEVRHMRRLYVEGAKSSEIAGIFGFNPRTVRKMLRNETWVDETYVPPTIKELGNRGNFDTSKIPKSDVKELRLRACLERKTAEEWASIYGITYGQARDILSGKTFKDPLFDPNKVKRENRHRKIDEAEVREIRRLQGLESAVSIGNRYGLTRGTVFKIWSRKSWRHVE